jgi:exonuclease SbcC
VLHGHRSAQPAHDAATAALLATETSRAAHAASLLLGEVRARVTADDTRRGDASGLRARIAQRRTQDAPWMQLNEVIGSTDGARFQRFAQGLTLDVLLAHANHQLRALAPRYALERVPGGDLELQVVDRDLADEVRPITSLSGGETFLASLALALGLGSLSSTHTPVDSLFIDEGFGTLDRDTLEVTLAALEALQRQGRKIGIVSHVEGLADQVDARVVVERRGGGLSRVLIRR